VAVVEEIADQEAVVQVELVAAETVVLETDLQTLVVAAVVLMTPKTIMLVLVEKVEL
jgi:hypothetical protein